MKKLISYIIITIMILSYCSIVMATENASFGIEVTSSKEKVNPGDEVKVIVKLKDLKNMTDGLYSFLATIEYDKEVFETLTQSDIKGLGTWSSVPTFNVNNGLLTADSSSGVKEESEVFEVTFKVKSTAKVGKSTQILVKDFEASEGNSDIQSNNQGTVTINVIQKEDNNNNSNNSSNNNNNNSANNNNSSNNNNTNNSNNNNSSNNNSSNDNKNNSSSNNNSNSGNANKKDSSSTNSSIPQTGEEDFIIIGAIVLTVLVMIIGYKGYKKYRGI